MNMSNLSVTSPATRELKPLHPFLRLVALLLAVALTLTGPVPMALAATTDSVTVTASGSFSITNLAQSGTILTVVAGGSLADSTGITLATGTLTGGTLSLTSLIFSGTSSFQNRDVNLSILSNLQLALGGSLTVPNGMSISYGPSSGILLGGGSAVINVGSSATQGGMVGASGGEIRVDNVSASRSTLTVNAGTVTTETASAAYLDLGTKLDLVKNGRGLLGLNALNSPVNGGSLSVFSGTATVTAGTLLVGDNFLSDGTSNSLKLTPATSNTSFPVIVALQGYAYVSSLLTSGGSASNVILGVSTDATSGQLVVNNAATDNSIFKGALADAVDGTPGFRMSVVKNGEGSLLLSNVSSSFTGGLTLNAGSLIVNADSSISPSDTTVISGPLGGGALNLRGGTLFVQPPYSYDLSDPLNPIVTRHTSILLHNQVSFFQLTDSDVAAGGSLVLQRKATFASANGTDTLTLAGLIDIDSSAVVTSGGSVTLLVNTPTVISGAITGDPGYGSLTGGSSTMALVKSGSAQLTLSGGNQYLGDFTVAQGTLLLGNTGALGINDSDLGTFSMNSLAVLTGGVLDLGGFSPAASTALILSGTGAGSGALTNSSPDLANYSGSLTLAAASSIGGAGDITLSGSVASAYNLTKLGTNILTFGGASTLSGSLLVSEGIAQIGSAGTLEFAATGGVVGDLVNNGVLRFNNSTDRTVVGTISGTGSLVKVGVYNLTLPGATYTGATTISAGSLTVKGALSTSQITNSGTFNWSPTTSVFTGSLSGSGQTILTSTSAVTLTLGTLGYTPSFDGNIKIGDNVTLSISAGAKLPGSIEVLSGGKLTLATGAGNVFGSTAKLTIDTGGSVDLKGNTVSFGTLTMAGGSLTSSGSAATVSSYGTLTGGTTNISNVTLPGTTVISSTILAGGTFKQMAGGSLGGTFSSGTYSQILLQPTGGASITLDGTVNAGTSVIASSGSGAFILQVQAPVLTPLLDIQSGVNATLLSGASLSTTGTLQVGGNVGLAGQSLAVGVLSLNGGSLTGGNLTAASIAAGSGTVTTVLSGSGTFTKTTGGTVTLSGANTLSGLMDLQAGLVQLAGSGSLTTGSLNVSGATLDLGGVSRGSGSLNLTGGSVTNGSLTATALNLQSGAVTSVLAGNATLSKTTPGIVTLSGVNTLSGSVQVSAGTLQLANGQSLAAASLVQITGGSLTFGGTVTAATLKSLAGNLSLNNVSGGSVTLTLANDAATTESGSLSGAGSLVKSGAGNLTLSGVNSYTGSTTVNSGILTTGTGALGNSAIVVNNGGTLTAADFGLTASLTVSGLAGTATILNSGTYGAISNAGSVVFNGGTVAVTGISGGGTTRFDGNATLNLVAGGTVNLNGTTSTVGTLNGGSVTVASGGTLTVTSGGADGVVSGSGSLAKVGSDVLALNSVLTGSVTVSAGTLSAVNYAQNSLLTVTGGQLVVSGSGLTLGTLFNGSIANFTANSGTITLGSLNGSGTTSFASNATISSVINSGTIFASTGRLQLTTLNGASVSAANLVLGTLNSGKATATSTGSLGTLNGGSLNLAGAQLSVGVLSAGTVTLSSLAKLTASSGTFTGLISGTGTLVKDTTSTTLTLGSAPVETIAVSVLGGSLTAGNLLSGNRSLSLASGSNLNLTLTTGSYSGVVTATEKTAALNLSSAAPVTLSLFGSSAKLDGLITLASPGITLDFSTAGTSPFGSNAGLIVTNGGTLALGINEANRELDLNTVTLTGGSLTLSGTGKLLYDTKPAFLTDNNTLVSGTSVIVAGSITFDVLTQGTLLSSGTYQYFAGKVKPLSGADSFLTANRVLLDPKSATTTIRLAGGTFNDSIVAGGTSHQGIVSIEGLVYAGSLGIASGATTVLSDAGTLLAGTASAAATPITNNGSLQASSSSGIKTIANVIGGSGSFEKVGSGTLVLSGSSTYTGTTTLSNGLLSMSNSLALGTLGSVIFKGGTLQYGSGVTADLSSRILGTASTSNFAIDTNGNNVAYGTGLSGTRLVKLGNGALTLNGENSFTGGVSISAGTLEFAGAMAANAEIASASLLRFNRADAAIFAGSLSGAGAIEKANTGVLTLSGSVSGYTGVLSLSGGTLVLGSTSALGGTLAFNGGVFQYGAGVTTDISSRIAPLTGGAARIDTGTNSVTFAGSLSGTGGLVKSGAGNLTLGNVPAETIAVSVLGGSLTVGNLLTGSRAVSVALGANLNLTLTTGSYSGSLTGLGATLLSGTAGATLSLSRSASLDGALKLDGNTLDLSYGDTNKFGPNATLTIANGGSLIVGTSSQELELGSLTVSSGSVFLSGKGGKILYDNKPAFLETYGDTVTLSSGTILNVGSSSSTVTIVGGSVTFDVLTQGTLLSGSVSGGSYQYTAGRVQLKGGTAITASSLLLDPKLATTTIRMSAGTVSGAIVLGGTSHQGILSVEGTVTAGSLGVTSGTTAKFTQAGSLQTSSGTATAIASSGTLQFSVTDGSKTVANLISGTGSLEKVDAGVLQLSGINTYSGNTVLSGGTAVLQNKDSFGTGSVVFNGGALQYGSGITTDLSKRIALLGSGTTATVDTNGNSVTFDNGLTGLGGVKKSGNGILALAGSNTFSGGLQVAAGTVQVGSGSSGSLASSANVDSGASLLFARTDSVTYSGALSGSGTVEQAGTGTLTLTGNNSSFAGTTVLSNGILSVGTALALGTSGSVLFNGGVLQYGTGVATDLSSKISAVLGKTETIDTNGNDLTFATALVGSGSFVKMGSGSLTFNAANSLATTVKAGTLVYNGVSSGSVSLIGGAVFYNLNGLTLSGNVDSSSGTNVSLNNSSVTAGTFSGAVSGAGSLLTSGNLSLTNSQKNTGGVTIGGGSLTLGTSSSPVSLGVSGAIITLAPGATLDAVNGSFDLDSSLVLSVASTLKLGEATQTLRNFTLSGGTVLSATALGDGADILVSGSISIGGTLQTSYTSADRKVTVGTVSKGNSGFISLTSNTGTLKGSVSGGSYDSVSTRVASNLKISSPINVIEGVYIGSGSVTLTSNLSAASVSIGSGSGGVALTVGSGASIKSDSVTFTSGTLKLSGSIGAATAGGGVVTFGGTSNAQSATVTLYGSSASITASKLGLNGGSTLTLDKDTLKALDGVKTLEIGGAGSSGTLTITSGTFTVVGNGHTLKGSGSLNGTVEMGQKSVLSPGNSPGNLTVTQLTAGSSSTIVLEYGSTVQDHVSGGTLNLVSGSTINIVDYDRSLLGGTGSYKPFDGITTLSGSSTVIVSVRLGNDTGTVNDTGVAYTTAESALYDGNYSGGTISVTATSLAALAASNNLSGNALTVAKALDSRLAALAAGGTFAVTAVDQIGTGVTRDIARASLPAQLAAANPSGYSELAGLSTQRVLNLNQGIVDHFRSLRTGLVEPQESNLTGWLSTYGSWQKQSGSSARGTAGFSGNTWGSLFGVEERVGDLTFGLNGAAGQTTADFQKLTGHISTDAWHVGVYAVARVGDVVLESNALVGLTDTTARRTIAATGLTSREGKLSVKGTEWLFNTGAALPLVVPGSWTITPSARLVAQGQNQDSAKESDLSGLEVSLSRQSTTSVLHQAGVELRKQLSLAGKFAAASLNTDWIHNYNAKGRNLNMAFGSSPTSFGYKGSDSGADAIRVSGAFEAALNERTTLRLSVDYQAQTRASSTNGAVSLGYAF
jgi:fibronectin-binding autotransporter adhesin